jgi:hypothetical protein
MSKRELNSGAGSGGAEIAATIAVVLDSVTSQERRYRRFRWPDAGKAVVKPDFHRGNQIAGEAIFEIGRRLKHVKENDLTHGQWEKWLKNNVNFSERQARRFMQIVDEFKTDDVVRIGTSKIFEIIQLPSDIDRQEFIEKSHVIPSTGETKTVDEMTVRELREVKKALKEARERAEQAEKQREMAEREAYAKICVREILIRTVLYYDGFFRLAICNNKKLSNCISSVI